MKKISDTEMLTWRNTQIIIQATFIQFYDKGNIHFMR